jgi:site-specific recombinase XerD
MSSKGISRYGRPAVTHPRPVDPFGHPHRAKLPSTVGLHTLWHSAASVMLSAGVPLKVVSEIFGHASVAITGDVYGHVSPDVSREALTRLSDALA